MTIDRLKELCEGEDLKYFLAPDRPMVTLGFGGSTGRFQFVIPIELDGRFLQIRTVGYLSCPADHARALPAEIIQSEACRQIISNLKRKRRLERAPFLFLLHLPMPLNTLKDFHCNHLNKLDSVLHLSLIYYS